VLNVEGDVDVEVLEVEVLTFTTGVSMPSISTCSSAASASSAASKRVCMSSVVMVEIASTRLLVMISVSSTSDALVPLPTKTTKLEFPSTVSASVGIVTVSSKSTLCAEVSVRLFGLKVRLLWTQTAVTVTHEGGTPRISAKLSAMPFKTSSLAA